MAAKEIVKMFAVIFSIFFIGNIPFSFANEEKDDSCSCYFLCNQNYTSNSVHDLQKISACQRGCRFYTLVLFSTSDADYVRRLLKAEEGCSKSCLESYYNPLELSACNFGCTALESSSVLCKSVPKRPQVSYALMVQESDFIIHPEPMDESGGRQRFHISQEMWNGVDQNQGTTGEPEPDDALTDPGLRKQIHKSYPSYLDATPKIPEIRFRNMPMKEEKIFELSHANYKCPKFYGFDSKFEIRNGKIIIGDLYLFLGVFIFVALCFLLGHHIETKNIKRQLMEARFPKNCELKEPLLKVCEIIEKDDIPTKVDLFDTDDTAQDPKIDAIAFVFRDEEMKKQEKDIPDVTIEL